MKGAGEGVELLPGRESTCSSIRSRKRDLVPPLASRAPGHDGRAHRCLGAVQGRPPEHELQLRDRRSGFVVAFDSDYPQEFVDLVGRLRFTEASLYTARDTPMFTCAKAPIEAILAQLANME